MARLALPPCFPRPDPLIDSRGVRRTVTSDRARNASPKREEGADALCVLLTMTKKWECGIRNHAMTSSATFSASAAASAAPRMPPCCAVRRRASLATASAVWGLEPFYLHLTAYLYLAGAFQPSTSRCSGAVGQSRWPFPSGITTSWHASIGPGLVAGVSSASYQVGGWCDLIDGCSRRWLRPPRGILLLA